MNKPHSFEESLLLFNSIYEKIDYIIDVGVQHKTGPLINVFPDKFHFLFEPVVTYHPFIRENYKNIRHELVPMAVSDKAGNLYQHLISQDNSGNITHSHLNASSEEVAAFKGMYKEIVPVEIITLDDFYHEKNVLTTWNSVLKIDIDGLDTNVMRGAEKILSHCPLMIVECPMGKIYERVKLANDFNFDVWDIVSPGYYMEQLSQVDIFFMNRKFRDECLDFHPWRKSKGVVHWADWVHFD
jgi:FkbM family methyltransferase